MQAVDENTPIANRFKSSLIVNLMDDLTNETLPAKFRAAAPDLHRDESSWKEEANIWIQHAEKLQNMLHVARIEKDKQANVIDDLTRDQTSLNTRISAMIMDQREVKNHWLAEKADLQSRLCQVQSLNTQISGTMKKKEKDYDKLQIQMSKLVKDASKGQKSCIQITAPLKKSLSQDQTNPAVQQLLKDAEIIALKNTIKALEAQNSSLKSVNANLSDRVEQLQSTIAGEVERRLLLADTTAKETLMITESVSQSTPPSSSQMSAPITGNPQATELSTPLPSANEELPLVAGSIAKKYLEGTPGARSVTWIVDQVNTEVKKLRARAEGCLDHGATPGANNKIASLRGKLAEAMTVIQEQDRLIHQALLGNLPATNSEEVVLWDVDEECDDLNPGLKASESMDLEDFLKWSDMDFLPPASPETAELLQSYGWAIPRAAGAQSSARRTTLSKKPLSPVKEPMEPEQLEF